MEDQVTTMSRLDAEKGIELLKEMTPEQQVSILLKAQSFQTLLMQYRCAIREIQTKLNVCLLYTSRSFWTCIRTAPRRSARIGSPAKRALFS